MTDKIKSFKEYINGKEITVIGIGISNTPLIKFLLKHGAKVTACDKKSKDELGPVADELISSGALLKLGENYLKDIKADIVFKTPGMRYDTPELLALKERGTVITSEMEEFMKICPAKIYAVTGSDGKTTTTTLIYTLLTEQGYKCHVGGNIGAPLLDKIDEIKETDIVVLELSSFQLHTIKTSPHVAVITNLSPNHLDWHKDYNEYIDAKKSIMLYQGKDDILVTNSSNDDSTPIGKSAKGIWRCFSSKKEAFTFSDGNYIFVNGEKYLNVSDIKIPGTHNVENYLAALAATYPLVSKETAEKVAKEFGGVPHRIELVRTIDGVRYYNSSIDSSPNRTINTLNVFSEPVILISGGKDKGISYDEIGAPILEKAKALILIGKTADAIEKAVFDAKKVSGSTKNLPIYRRETYEEVVLLAKELAQCGDVVLLSNASTSFDMFKNFEERGNYFKKLVNNL
ncbi:MAG: UDP-N-acetylmuramoyl-L-alanine--D-glutamate ligase [Ruminococcaceae bacterium]|nr:UDP-N-acetylmuramoyl-L-alanine--D-glutamate ligase [Oscillospiraceae bacterium]